MLQIIWEYRVSQEYWESFEKFYGAEGDWAQLFGRSAEFRGTTLLRDRAVAGRYLTIDSWSERPRSSDSWKGMVRKYKMLDVQCEEWTAYEMKVGTFESL
jgi:hypothetical protein